MTAVDAQALATPIRMAVEFLFEQSERTRMYQDARDDSLAALDGLVEALGQRDEDIATLREWADRRRGAAWLGNDS